MATSTPKYKICKNCGNRNHPDSGQCPWCGARLRMRMDWFSTLSLLFIALVVVGLILYALQNRTPTPTKLRLPIHRSAEHSDGE